MAAYEENVSPAYGFAPRFADVLGAKMHYVEQGTGKPVLFLHGNPTSSYLWRNILPRVAEAGLGRCIAPDLIGMGKSDKPDIGYRIADHVRYLDGFIAALGLKDIALVVHDWGSALGLHYARRHEADIRALAMMESILTPVPRWDDFHPDLAAIFKQFRTEGVGQDLICAQNVFIEKILPGACVRPLGDAEMKHYRAPFPTPESRTPLWVFPNEIPIEGRPKDVHDLVAAYSAWLQKTPLPKLLFTTDKGALVPPPVAAWAKDRFPNIELVDLGAGIHYVQEDHPAAIATALIDFLKRKG